MFEALDNWASAPLKTYYVSDDSTRKSFLLEAKEKAQRASNIQAGSGDYNLGCTSSLLGEIDEAASLITADLERRPHMRAHALDDPDLNPLWKLDLNSGQP